MLEIKITFDTAENDINDHIITISSKDNDLNEEHYESYHDNSNPYDMCECLEDFIRLHVEIRD